MPGNLFQSDSISLEDHDIHIWQIDDEACRLPEMLSSFEASLDNEERGRRDRFVFEKDQHQYLIAHGALRYVLSRYETSIAPVAWEFEKNEYGRPDIKPPNKALPLFFNISHTKGKVLIAVSRHEMIGVDIELESRKTEPTKLADRFFSESEAEALLALPEQAQAQRFFRLWTLKEAYIKACGMGLSIPLDHFSFGFEAANSISIDFAPDRKDESNAWTFWHWELSSDYRASLAYKSQSRHAPIELKHWQIKPSGDYDEVELHPILKSNS